MQKKSVGYDFRLDKKKKSVNTGNKF